MLNETIKRLRTERGMTQEQLASRLHVVRQTVSKWEKGLSVPDAELLTRLAEELGVSVHVLLGDGEKEAEPTEQEERISRLAGQLAELNAQLARQQERKRHILRGICVVLLLLALLAVLAELVFQWMLTGEVENAVGVIGGAEGPTQIFVASTPTNPVLTCGIPLALLSLLGLILTRRK